MDKNERRSLIVKMYVEDNKSINAIAKELGMAWNTVKKTLIEQEITIATTRNQHSTKSLVPESLFSEILTEADAYWLGLLYADGSIRKDRNEIVLDLSEKDYQTVLNFHQYCGNHNTIREHIIRRDQKEYKSFVSGFSNAKVRENLIRLGCIPQKSLILKCPTEEQVPQKLFHHFLRGYIDGDGYIQFDEEKHRYRIIICGTEDFLSGVMKRMNFFSGCSISKDPRSNIFLLSIGGKEIVFDILKTLYGEATIKMERKSAIFENIKSGIPKKNQFC